MKKIAALLCLALGLSVGTVNATTIDVGTLGTKAVTSIFSSSPGSFIDDTINFNVSGPSTLGGSASNLQLSLFGIDLLDISGLGANVWNNHHPFGTTLIGSFAGDGLTHTFLLPAAGDYHVDIFGEATGVSGGLYAVALNAAPVPEPETWMMLAIGAALVGFQLRRKANAMESLSIAV